MRAALAAAVVSGLAATSALAIVGGEPDGSALARQTVMVLNSRGGVCSGVVLGPGAVLTAAHCVAGGSEIRVHWKAADGSPVLVAPAGLALHPGYVAGAMAARRRSIDLALLRVDPPLPARFAPAALSDAPPGTGEGVAAAGYGVSREGDARSTGTFRSASLAVVTPYGRSTVLLWAKDPAGGGAGACEGDSGGPMTASDGGVLAITSWATGPRGKTCGDISQGVLVGPQRGWIDRILAGWGAAASWR